MTLDATIATTRPAPGTALVTINGHLDTYSAPDVRAALIALINEGRYRQVVDLTAVTFLDSTGLAVLVGAAKRAVAHGGGSRTSWRRIRGTRRTSRGRRSRSGGISSCWCARCFVAWRTGVSRWFSRIRTSGPQPERRRPRFTVETGGGEGRVSRRGGGTRTGRGATGSAIRE